MGWTGILANLNFQRYFPLVTGKDPAVNFLPLRVGKAAVLSLFMDEWLAHSLCRLSSGLRRALQVSKMHLEDPK